MRRIVAGLVLFVATCHMGGTAHGQVMVGGVIGSGPVRFGGYYAAPGNYAMGWGVPSYGSVQTYSTFASPYGVGYGFGYPPYGVLPGRYGVGLWRPGYAAPGYVYGGVYPAYRTYPVPYLAARPMVAGPPVGVYAPAYGPGSFYGW
jgi:hypothetical protein